MVVASVTGSAPDIIARHLAVKLTEAWGQQIVVDTRPGASGIIGAETTAKAAPDGYTLWLGTQTQLISTLLQGKLAMSREFAPVGFVATTTFVLVASAAMPAKTHRGIHRSREGPARPALLLHRRGRIVGASVRRAVEAHDRHRPRPRPLQGEPALPSPT